MKIGLSYSRCIRDIVDGKVEIDEVLVIISRTNFDPNDDTQWAGIWSGYGGGQNEGSIWSAPEWAGYKDEELFRNISKGLYNTGKLHQPRQFGARPQRRPEYWLETCLPDFEMEDRPAVKKAWDQFQAVAGLTNTKLNKEYQ